MDNLEQTIQGVLNNPEMMQQIMGLAGSLGLSGGGSGKEPEQEAPKEQASVLPDVDMSQLSRLSGLLSKANLDGDQQNLCNALSPFLSGSRVQKLKKAMRAAKIAELAEGLLGSGLGGGGYV